MSTGKRLAKRSIVGTRVVAPGDDGLLYSGVITTVKTSSDDSSTKYAVRLEHFRRIAVFKDRDLIGPGFGSIHGLTLQQGQKVYLTYNGREISGLVQTHDPSKDEVLVHISPPGIEGPLELKKRIDEVRLLESRKSARLMDQDTDFARLADIGDRKRASSHCIDVPAVHGSRKRRPSTSQDEVGKEDLMNECTAALVLMSLSCSPHSPGLNGVNWNGRISPSPSLTDSWRSSTPSPPLSEGGGGWANNSTTDEGIVIDEDFDELPRKKKANHMVFRCTWPGCNVMMTTCSGIESHVRKKHLAHRPDDECCMDDDHEEEFYYTEVELGPTSSPPTCDRSHWDMVRPPHEDPEYQRTLTTSFSAIGQQIAHPINIPGGSSSAPQWSLSATTSPNSPQKHIKLSVSAPTAKLPSSPTRKMRGETKKCRKVYGMEHRELWCTQCKWKKACTRFGD
ncbi:zinc finger protein 395-like isoform X2 [Lycorma delicatula]|uniref:zinc finger protein 395-like isoform X2 n=1 Tax=Lycorma delicatula TaxID=130591 RepID=UPI003F51A55E